MGLIEIPTKENAPVVFTQPTDVRFSYASSKFLSEFLFTQFSKKYQIPTAIIRYHNIYGPRMGMRHVIPELITRLNNGESPLKVYGANESRAFCYISDAVDGVYKAMKSNISKGKIINLGYGKPVMLRTVIEKIKFKIKQGKPDYGKIKMRKEEQLINYPNISVAKNQLKWKSKISILEGLDKTIQYFKKNNKLNNYD